MLLQLTNSKCATGVEHVEYFEDSNWSWKLRDLDQFKGKVRRQIWV